MPVKKFTFTPEKLVVLVLSWFFLEALMGFTYQSAVQISFKLQPMLVFKPDCLLSVG